MGKVWGRLEVGWEKMVCRSTKAAISLKRVKIEEKLLWIEGLYRKVTNALSNGTIPDPIGAWAYPGTANFFQHPLLSQERTSNFVRTFLVGLSIGTKAHYKFREK